MLRINYWCRKAFLLGYIQWKWEQQLFGKDGVACTQIAPSSRPVWILLIIRNITIFAPIAITWYAISIATSAFSAYNQGNPISNLNFLDFWENGYGILHAPFTLSSVAKLDFFIILLIILLNIWSSLLNMRSSAQDQKLKSNFELSRVAIAIELNKLKDTIFWYGAHK